MTFLGFTCQLNLHGSYHTENSREVNPESHSWDVTGAEATRTTHGEKTLSGNVDQLLNVE